MIAEYGSSAKALFAYNIFLPLTLILLRKMFSITKLSNLFALPMSEVADALQNMLTIST